MLYIQIAFIYWMSIAGLMAPQNPQVHVDEIRFVSHIVDLNKQQLDLYWKNESGDIYGNFKDLRSELSKGDRKLIFAMNGGMYNKDQSPQGLYIERGILKAPLDTSQSGYGNFYLQPNGIFYIKDDHTAAISISTAFQNRPAIKYATQSGPMLLIEGSIHPKFTEGSSNLHIRNGVGILPDGRILFAMSKKKVNFFDFASYFKEQGCQNALYLDGFVSRTYLPSAHWEQLDGNFGVIIAETEREG